MKFILSSFILATFSIKFVLGVAVNYQCGGINDHSDTTCEAGVVCVSPQCLLDSNPSTATTTKTSTTTTETTPNSADNTPAPTGSFKNPIRGPNGADPFMVYDDGYYYLLTTSGKIQITRATTIAGLKTATPKVILTQSSVASRCCNYWAPEIHKINGTWYLYYTAGPSGTVAHQHVHVLQGGSTPYDTYTYKAQLAPTNAPNDWAIDGTILTISGKNYFVFSGQDTTGQTLWIAPLTNAWTAGARSLISQPLQSWERHGPNPVNEGPQPLYHNGATYLTYSASHCSTPYYSLGLLKYNGGDPTSMKSWTKTGPVLTSANGNYGTGHNGFFTTPGGVTYIVFHATANPKGDCGASRYTMIQPMSWASDGVTPVFPVPAPLSASIPAYP